MTPRPRLCLECGADLNQKQRDFCQPDHRKAFNNRRMTRGAEVYDLFMALRYDRNVATALKVWKLLCRMAAVFREDDRRHRNGVRSWQPPRRVIACNTHLFADVLSNKTWKVVGR